jgi:hypothetical protein
VSETVVADDCLVGWNHVACGFTDEFSRGFEGVGFTFEFVDAALQVEVEQYLFGFCVSRAFTIPRKVVLA